MGCGCSKRIKTRTLKPGQVRTAQRKEESKLSRLKQMWEAAKKENNSDNPVSEN